LPHLGSLQGLQPEILRYRIGYPTAAIWANSNQKHERSSYF